MKKILIALLVSGCSMELHTTDIGAGQYDIWADFAGKQEKMLAARQKANEICGRAGYTVVNKDEDDELGTDKHHLVIRCNEEPEVLPRGRQ